MVWECKVKENPQCMKYTKDSANKLTSSISHFFQDLSKFFLSQYVKSRSRLWERCSDGNSEFGFTF